MNVLESGLSIASQAQRLFLSVCFFHAFLPCASNTSPSVSPLIPAPPPRLGSNRPAFFAELGASQHPIFQALQAYL